MSLKSESRWYVYTLADPRDGAIFYVGKGTGSRVDQHEKDAANPKTACSKKINKIRDLQSLSLSAEKARIAYFWDEQAAYDHETDLIEEIGLDALTNVLPGGQKAWERRRIERAARRPQQKKVEPLHVYLGKSAPGVLFERFAEWFKSGLHLGGLELKVTVSDPAFKWNGVITEIVYNKMLPNMWKHICADEKAIDVFRERIRPYGIEAA